MPQHPRSLAAAIAASLLLLGGCVNSLPPRTSLGDRACTDEISLADALQVVIPEAVRVEVNETVGCQQSGEQRRAYVVFLLPESTETYLLSVSSFVRGTTLFSPSLELLDAAGAPLRQVERETFLYRGMSLNASIRVRPGERYLVVRSDAGTVGQQSSQITSETRATAIYGVGTIYSGSEVPRSIVLTHNGTIEVSARLLPKAG